MILSFGNDLAKDLWRNIQTNQTRRFPPELHRAAKNKLQSLHSATTLEDVRSPPGNRLHALQGNLANYHAIRINDQWRVIFIWKDGNAHNVSIDDYHH